MSKGMVYTMFALTASTIIVLMVLVPFQGMDLGTDGEASMIGQASYYQDKIFRDAERASSIALNRALSEAINYVINSGSPLDEPSKDLESILLSGTIDGIELEYMQNASMYTWFGRVENISEETAYSVDFSAVEAEFGKEDEFTMSSEIEMRSILSDPRTLTEFNRTEKLEATSSIIGLEDPMMRVQTVDTYGQFFSRCDFNTPAEQIYTGSDGSGSDAWGRAYVEPDTGNIESFESSVLVTSDLSQYNQNQVDQFTGVVSANEVNNPGAYNDNYVIGTGSIAGIDQNDSILIHDDEVWNSHFRYMVEEGCYMVSEGPMNGPDFYDRLANRLTGSRDTGLVSLVNKTEVPGSEADASNVGYVYFNDTSAYGSNQEIAGVTYGDGDSVYNSDFRIDEYHVERWGIEPLVE